MWSCIVLLFSNDSRDLCSLRSGPSYLRIYINPYIGYICACVHKTHTIIVAYKPHRTSTFVTRVRDTVPGPTTTTQRQRRRHRSAAPPVCSLTSAHRTYNGTCYTHIAHRVKRINYRAGLRSWCVPAAAASATDKRKTCVVSSVLWVCVCVSDSRIRGMPVCRLSGRPGENDGTGACFCVCMFACSSVDEHFERSHGRVPRWCRSLQPSFLAAYTTKRHHPTSTQRSV